MGLAQLSIRHARAVAFLTAALTCLGVWAYLQTPASIFPELHVSRIDVVADAGDLPPEQVRVAVAMPLERAFLGLPSAQRVTATSAQGSAELVVEFDPKTDPVTDLQYVDGAVAQSRSALPAGAGVVANVVNPASEPILSYALTSASISQTLVREYADRSLLPALYGVPGLARILVVGGGRREYRVELDPAALAAAGLSASDAASSIATANDVEAVGFAQAGAQRRAVLIDAGVRDAAQIARIAVPTHDGSSATIGSLGSVGLDVAPLSQQMSFDATHAVALSFYALPGADAVRVADGVKARLRALDAQLPAGVKPHLYWDATDSIVASQTSLRDAILAGALLALGVIFFFLRNARMTLVAAIVIPSAMAISVLAISLFGATLNIMSVGGLAIAVGLIIDDAIVVIEGIAHTMASARERGGTPDVRDAIAATMGRLIAPMTASTLTTIVVFLPLALLGGVSGAFFRALALTLSCALAVSLALALFVTPMLFRALLAKHEPPPENAGIRHALDRYEPLLRWALARRSFVYGAAGVTLAATVVLLALLPSDFLPALDEGQFEIAYRMPVGTTLEASDAAALAMERAVMADPAVAAEGRFTGIDTNGYSPTPVREGTIRVKLRPMRERASFDEIGDRLRDALAASVPAAQFDIHQILEDLIGDVSGAPAPIQVVLRGPDQSVLVAGATRLANELGKTPGIADAFSGVDEDDPLLRVTPDLARLARAGSDASGLAAALGATAQGTVATQLAQPAMLVPVRVAVAGSSAPSSVSFASGALPLAQVARTSVDRSSTDVTEIDGARAIVLTANVNGSLSTAIAGVRQAILRAHLPPGYRASIEGAYRAQQDSFRQFAEVIAIAIVLVFFVMLVAFRSFRRPLVILCAVPLAPIGVALALTLTRTPFNVSSFMGLLLLVGLVVKNGILLVDAANRHRALGAPVDDALVLAGRERLRPILMTTFAAIGGLLPLALGIGEGAAMERPLAIAVVGGLSTATAFTLVLIPVLYASFADGVEPA